MSVVFTNRWWKNICCHCICGTWSVTITSSCNSHRFCIPQWTL